MEAAVRALAAGRLIVMVTDTVYGVAAHPDLPDALERIYAVKRREKGKPVPMLVSGIEAARKRGGQFGPSAEKLANSFWPGPLTIVVPAGEATQGYRMPDHSLALELIRRSGGALYATSANVSGDAPALTPEEAIAALGKGIAAVVDGNPVPSCVASTVVKVDGDCVTVLREGAVSRKEIDECLAE